VVVVVLASVVLDVVVLSSGVVVKEDEDVDELASVWANTESGRTQTMDIIRKYLDKFFIL